MVAVEVYKHADYLCQNHILNAPHVALFIMYSLKVNVKELWVFLDKMYKVDDVGAKKFIVDKFLDLQIVNENSIIEQVKEIQLIYQELIVEDMFINEAF